MDEAASPRMIKFGPYVVDMRSGELRKNGIRIRLQEKPLRVLALLAEWQGELVTREELKKQLWPSDTFVDFETGLNTAVSKLRDALSDKAEEPRFIETIPRRGYRFISSVEVVSSRQISGVAPASVAPNVAEAVSSESSGTEDVGSGEGKRSRIALMALAGLGLLVMGGVAVWFFQGRSALSFNSRDSVLIADFENETGDPRFDNALATAFIVSIEQSRYANVFPRTRLDEALARMGKPRGERITPALGREVCQRENIRGLLACSVTRTGQEYALTAQLIDPRTGETVRSYTEHAQGEDHVLGALDILSQEVRQALGESLYQIHQANKPLPQVTTASLTALQQYAEGSTLWHQGKYREAVVMYQAAVSSDPNFAVAHAALGGAYYSYITNAPEEGQKEYQKALSLSSHTTDRERMQIEARYAEDRNHADEAEALSRAYLDRYPEDVVMRYNYASLLRHDHRETDAIEQYKEVLRSAPDFAQAYVGIATAYKSVGKYPEALQAYSRAFDIEPQWLTAGNVNREYGFSLVANGEQQKAEQVFSALLAKPETRENGLRSLAFLDLYRGRYASAKDRLQQSLETLKTQNAPLSLGRVHMLLAIVAQGRGDTKGERQNLDAAQDDLKGIEQKVIFGAMLGDAYARANLPDQARQIAAVITPFADQHSSEQMGYLHLLEGDIALATGNRDKAIEFLTLSDRENTTAFSIEAIAHAYQQSGDMDNAIMSYEKILSSAKRSLGWEPQQRWPEARYTLASDYFSRGEKQKARETLSTLLTLWKDADPNLPLLKQAKAEYAKLE